MTGGEITQIIIAIIGIIVPLATLYVSVKGQSKSDSNHKENKSANFILQRSVEDLKVQVDGMSQRLDQNDLQTARNDFRMCIVHSPDDIPATLEIARVYFLNLGGNADMGRKFLAWVKKYEVQKWADEHDEDISNLIEAAKHSA